MENYYKLNTSIDTENQIIKTIVNLDYYTKDNLNNLEFYINDKIDIKVTKCNYDFNYEVYTNKDSNVPFIPECKIIRINFKNSIEKNEKINLNFLCEGKFDITDNITVNSLNSEWIELGLYSLWHPVFKSLESAKFDADINISDEYTVVNSFQNKSYQSIVQVQPTVDCTIIASNKFKYVSRSSEGMDVKSYYTKTDKKPIANKIIDYIDIVSKTFLKFGQTSIKNLSIVIGDRTEGGGYCRPGLIVLSSPENFDELGYFHFISHEFAHMWWCDAPTDSYEDWLNESFAEYSALIAIREEFGKEVFNSILDRYKENSKGLKPIINLKRNNANAYTILYEKGPCLLNILESKIGEHEFIELLKEMKVRKIINTDTFLDLLEERYNKDIKHYFYQLLSS